MDKITIREVAKRAEVGVGTVSRVLNESPDVSAETRAHVLAVIAELDYIPNTLARRLSLGRTLMIAVVLPHLTFPSFVERLRGVQHGLDESDYDLVLFSVGSPAQRDKYFHELSSRSRADGILIISLSPDQEQVARFKRLEVPVVLVDAYHDELNKVMVDDAQGGELATRHLIELGHREIGFISDYLQTPYRFVSMQQRFNGFQRAIKEAGMPFHSEWVREGMHGRAPARRMAHEILEQPQAPTAIFAASDTQAIGVMDAARDLGMRIPGDLAVIGYDNIRDAEFTDLTTIEQPLFESGQKGVGMLLAALEQMPDQPQEICLPTRLIKRGTTANLH